MRYYLAQGQSLEFLCNLNTVEKVTLKVFMEKDLEDKQKYIEAIMGV